MGGRLSGWFSGRECERRVDQGRSSERVRCGARQRQIPDLPPAWQITRREKGFTARGVQPQKASDVDTKLRDLEAENARLKEKLLAVEKDKIAERTESDLNERDALPMRGPPHGTSKSGEPDSTIDKAANAATPVPAITQQQSMGEQSVTQAKTCFASHFLQRGDCWVSLSKDDVGFMTWWEFNTPTFQVLPSNSTADRLNGLEYRAKVHVSAKAERFFDPNERTKWQWEDGGKLDYEIVKQNGVWRCVGLEHYFKPQPGEAPN